MIFYSGRLLLLNLARRDPHDVDGVADHVGWAPVLLWLVAVAAIFRLRLGMIPTLALCSVLGVAVYALR